MIQSPSSLCRPAYRDQGAGALGRLLALMVLFTVVGPLQAQGKTHPPNEIRINIYQITKKPTNLFTAQQVNGIIDDVARHLAPLGVETRLGRHRIVAPTEEAPAGFHFIFVDRVPGASADEDLFEKIYRRHLGGGSTPEAGIGGKAVVRCFWKDLPDPYGDPRRIPRMGAVITHALAHLLGLEDSSEPGNLMHPQSVVEYPPPLAWGEVRQGPPPPLGLTHEQVIQLRTQLGL